jgi:hypothetical protein
MRTKHCVVYIVAANTEYHIGLHAQCQIFLLRF